jgi:hypothetical protein
MVLRISRGNLVVPIARVKQRHLAIDRALVERSGAKRGRHVFLLFSI